MLSTIEQLKEESRQTQRNDQRQSENGSDETDSGNAKNGGGAVDQSLIDDLELEISDLTSRCTHLYYGTMFHCNAIELVYCTSID